MTDIIRGINKVMNSLIYLLTIFTFLCCEGTNFQAISDGDKILYKEQNVQIAELKIIDIIDGNINNMNINPKTLDNIKFNSNGNGFFIHNAKELKIFNSTTNEFKKHIINIPLIDEYDYGLYVFNLNPIDENLFVFSNNRKLFIYSLSDERIENTINIKATLISNISVNHKKNLIAVLYHKGESVLNPGPAYLSLYNIENDSLDIIDLDISLLYNWSKDGNLLLYKDKNLVPQIFDYQKRETKTITFAYLDTLQIQPDIFLIDETRLVFSDLKKDKSDIYIYDFLENKLLNKLTQDEGKKTLLDIYLE